MTALPCANGITSQRIQTKRLDTHFYRSAEGQSTPILMIHGNFSSAFWFQDLMLSLPEWDCLAVDLRGYGESESLPVDARRGAKDWSEDLEALLDSLGLEQIHLLGWSTGGAAAMQFFIDRPDVIKSLTLLAPVSPFGFGGTRGADGQPNFDDYAGSGGGVVSADFIHRLKKKDRGLDSPFSPRNQFRQMFVEPPFLFPNEDALLTSSLMQAVGEYFYPGDFRGSQNWPGVAPGDWGAINAMSPKYFHLGHLSEQGVDIPILWIRGDLDRVIHDRSASDLAVLGELGYIEGWPGSEVFPSQPMVEQTRYVLNAYQKNGGEYEEYVLEGVGHTPHMERPEHCRNKLSEFLLRVEKRY